MPVSPKAQKIYAVFCGFFLLLGVISRILIYAKGQDLLLSEALFWENMKPLIAGFSISELGLRLFPLLAGIATLLLAYVFARKEFGIEFACIFLFLLVSSDPLLFYSVNFSMYSIEAFLVVLSLCVWSYSKRDKAALVSLILLVSIFCIICNYNENPGAYEFKEFFIQMLGRHFIDFHYFVFGPFIWINAALFVLLLGFGSFLLYKEKKSLLLSIFIPVFILALLHFLKIAPLGEPYNDFMRIMRNWSLVQVTGSKELVFIMPLVFIPVAFCVHRVFLKVRTPTLIGVLTIFAILALSSNSIRMHKGIGSPQSAEVLLHINENATAKSLVYADSASRPVLEYYMSRKPFKDNPNLNCLYVKKDGYMYLNDSIFIGKYGKNPVELFNVIKNFEAENGFFFFAFGSASSVRESNVVVDHIYKNYKGKSKGFQSKYAGVAWVRL